LYIEELIYNGYITMEIHTNIPLKNYTTMKLGGNARFMADIHSRDELAEVYKNASVQNLPVFILGDGSNTIVKDNGYNGLVIRLRIPGFEVVAEDINSKTIKIGAGEEWDSVVQRTVDMGLSGIENMSRIPGTAGAAPVQNIGAYGQELADTMQSLEAFDSQTNTFITMQNSDCGFSYRNSIFRSKQFGRYAIVSITIKLSKNMPQPPFYDSLQRYLDANDIKLFTVDVIRNAITEIRKSKIPNPADMPNSGSFFKNATIEKWQLDELQAKYPDLKAFDMGSGTYKVYTGWLIEKAGLKGVLINGIRVYEKNTLVLVNESATSYADLATARDEVAGKVRNMFRIQIEQEPIEI
jgi:UDP-N-acetylmuramate dehydrogenase